ncbi:histidine kinase dimerization/phospho-acceptor domain-containing protein, partial [Enterobacter hormaechei]|uniref:histidine kinase dimerization/phospho-acceptor domain-containing protein n=1 Tax=Enterobacter hormaechei TaxID=158836 RepID=UPI0023B789CB
ALVAARKAGVELSNEVANRTRELRATNEALHLEVEERRRTEAQLLDTQNSLVQAGKLAALGQMSAAIAHEINQPVAAIRTFAENASTFLDRAAPDNARANLKQIVSLTERIGTITSE